MTFKKRPLDSTPERGEQIGTVHMARELERLEAEVTHLRAETEKWRGRYMDIVKEHSSDYHDALTTSHTLSSLHSRIDALETERSNLRAENQRLELSVCEERARCQATYAGQARQVGELRAEVAQLREALETIICRMRNLKPYKSHDLGFADSVSVNTVEDLADELEALLRNPGGEHG